METLKEKIEEILDDNYMEDVARLVDRNLLLNYHDTFITTKLVKQFEFNKDCNKINIFDKKTNTITQYIYYLTIDAFYINNKMRELHNIIKTSGIDINKYFDILGDEYDY